MISPTTRLFWEPKDAILTFLRNQSQRIALVEYWQGTEDIHASVFLPEHDQPIFFKGLLSNQEMDRLLGLIGQELRQPLDSKWWMWPELGKKLARPIIELCGDKRLVYVASHGRILNVPLHAIPFGDGPLGLHVPLVYTNAGLLLPFVAQSERTIRVGASVAVIGNPSRNLPGAENEARRIASLFHVEPLLKSKALLSTLDSLRGMDLVHIAAHGYFDRRDPYRSGIVFYDGILTVEKVLRLRLGIPLVVLSSCETGRGGHEAGEDLAALASAFVATGTHTVLASLWQTDDEASEFFMLAFYEECLRGCSPVEALRIVVGKMQNDGNRWSNAFYWAPYVLIGSGK